MKLFKNLSFILLLVIGVSCHDEITPLVPLNSSSSSSSSGSSGSSGGTPPSNSGSTGTDIDATATADNGNLLFGNPSGATHDVINYDNYLLDTKVSGTSTSSYIMSYNRTRATPNWVSWYVGPNWVGTTDRSNDFRANPALPSGWYEVNESSYQFSKYGFERGHNCPSGDRTTTSSVAINQTTFFMTNMIPQVPNNNEKTWANLESYGRDLIDQGNEIYVIMGSYGQGGTSANGTYSTIVDGSNTITVPSQIWKVIVVIPKGDGDLGRVTSSTRVIAVNTPNINSINSAWGGYRVSVDAIEAATGYDLLSALPDDIEATLEAKVDTGATN